MHCLVVFRRMASPLLLQEAAAVQSVYVISGGERAT
jgi:hypothetical protein